MSRRILNASIIRAEEIYTSRCYSVRSAQLCHDPQFRVGSLRFLMLAGAAFADGNEMHLDEWEVA
jgi:hypothetical protein